MEAFAPHRRLLRGPTGCSLAAYSSVWHRWTAPSNGWVEAHTEGSGFDTVLAVYTGTVVNALGMLGNNDDDGATSASRVEFYARQGVTYRLAVDGVRGEEGSYQIGVRPAPPVPAIALRGRYDGLFDNLELSFPGRPNRYYELFEGAEPNALTNLIQSTTAFDTNVFFFVTPSGDRQYFRARASDPP